MARSSLKKKEKKVARVILGPISVCLTAPRDLGCVSTHEGGKEAFEGSMRAHLLAVISNMFGEIGMRFGAYRADRYIFAKTCKSR